MKLYPNKSIPRQNESRLPSPDKQRHFPHFKPTPIRVQVAEVGRGALQVTVNAEGKTRIQERYVITAPANGQLDRIRLDAGNPVQPDMLVAQNDPVPLTDSVEKALDRLAEAESQRIGVETQRPKSETLTQARTRIRKTEADHQQALARIQQAQAALTQSQREQVRAGQLAQASRSYFSARPESG